MPERKVETLLPLIRKVIQTGTISYSDECRAYRTISSLGFSHKTVNHSLHFIEPDTGVHMQNIVLYWSKVKLILKQLKRIRR